MPPVLQKYRHPNERLYGGLLTGTGLILWLFLGIIAVAASITDPRAAAQFVLFAVYAVSFMLALVIFAALYRARAMGHMVLLSEKQFPHLHSMFVEVSQKLGLDETPIAFIYNSGGIMNAFAIRLLRGRYVFLTSAIVEAEEDEQIRFIMAHEVAHHVLGHLSGFKHFLRWPAYMVPFLYRAYSRAREYSCDAVGASVLPDARHALGALQMLACGVKRLNASMNVEAFAAQEYAVPSVAGFVLEISSTHPRTTRRVARIRALFAMRDAPQLEARARLSPDILD